MFKKIFNFLLDLLWPQFCLGCGQEGSLTCAACLAKLDILEPKPIHWPDLTASHFQACFVCLDYNHKFIEKMIKRYKYDYIENLSKALSSILYRQAKKLDLAPNTIITNIPLHNYKRRKRGFDQTEILARRLGNSLHLDYQTLLRRIKKTKSQAQMTKTQRQKNIAGAFALLNPAKKELTDRPVLLLDDITTTGATLDEAARVLQEAGYKKIKCLVLAKNNP